MKGGYFGPIFSSWQSSVGNWRSVFRDGYCISKWPVLGDGYCKMIVIGGQYLGD